MKNFMRRGGKGREKDGTPRAAQGSAPGEEGAGRKPAGQAGTRDGREGKTAADEGAAEIKEKDGERRSASQTGAAAGACADRRTAAFAGGTDGRGTEPGTRTGTAPEKRGAAQGESGTGEKTGYEAEKMSGDQTNGSTAETDPGGAGKNAAGEEDIRIEELCVKFLTPMGEVCAVKNLSAEFKMGRITGVIGESGSGKSVMGMSIVRLLPENSVLEGRCMYQGRDLYHITEQEMERIRGSGIGLIPQNPGASLNPSVKIGKQLREALLVHGIAGKKEAQKRVRELLADFGFEQPEQIMEQYAFQMSGGMNQRIVSVLGLSCDPRWIIADEPTKGLDSVVRKQVFGVLKRIWGERRCGMIVITHDLLLAYHLCDEVKVMYNGEIIEQGPCRLVMDAPCHPYTEGLIGALPSRGMRPVPGRPKEGKTGESSCIYYGRCPKACGRCRRQDMQNFPAGDGRKVRCFLYA